MNRKHWSPDHPAVMAWHKEPERTLQQRTDAVVQRHRARKAQHRPDWVQRINTLTGFVILLGLLPLILMLDEHNVPPIASLTVLFGGLALAVLIMSESHRDDLP
jgi:hypothetical protein